MFTPTYDQEWLQQKIAEGDDGFINAGGMRTEPAGNPVAESSSATPSYSQRKALAKFVEFSRRKQQMTQRTLADKIAVDINVIIEIEDESAVSVTHETIVALAREFGVPEKPVLELAGVTMTNNQKMLEASAMFAADSGISLPLCSEEEHLLETFVNTLISMK